MGDLNERLHATLDKSITPESREDCASFYWRKFRLIQECSNIAVYKTIAN